MFTRPRKARVLFGLSDIVLGALAFEAAYQTRAVLHLEHTFYLTVERKALVLGFALVAWVTIGLWLGIYEKLDSGHPRVILRDTVRQCGYGALCLCCSNTSALGSQPLVPGAVLRLRLGAAAAVPADGGRVVGVIRRGFAAPHYVMWWEPGSAPFGWRRRWNNRRNTASGCAAS